jgi:hypothetical protein
MRHVRRETGILESGGLAQSRTARRRRPLQHVFTPLLGHRNKFRLQTDFWHLRARRCEQAIPGELSGRSMTPR